MSVNFENLEQELELLAKLTFEVVTPLVDSNFIVKNLDSEISVCLKFVNKQPSNEATIRQPFSMIFHCSDCLPQDNYLVKHEALGELPLFMVPIGKIENDFEYQAIIS